MTSEYVLDDKAKFPGTTNPSIEEYARACSDAIDEASEDWPISVTTKNATVSTGFVRDNKLRSTLWRQSFGVVANDNDGNSNDDGRYSSVVLEDLLSNLKDLFASDDLGKHAEQWDATYAGADLVGKLSDDTMLVHWKFNASPLTGRDMLYVVHQLKEEPIKSQTDSDKKDKENADNENTNVVLRLTYAYASVSDEWARDYGGKEIDSGNGGRRVRAFNCYPSCDRITVSKDNNTSSDSSGITKITVDHLMTTDLGGWIGPFCFNNMFKRALIQSNVHECEAIRDYALSLCKTGDDMT